MTDHERDEIIAEIADHLLAGHHPTLTLEEKAKVREILLAAGADEPHPNDRQWPAKRDIEWMIEECPSVRTARRLYKPKAIGVEQNEAAL